RGEIRAVHTDPLGSAPGCFGGGECLLGIGQGPLDFLACLANLIARGAVRLELQEGVQIPQQRGVVALPDVDVGQEQMEQRVIGIALAGFFCNFLGSLHPVSPIRTRASSNWPYQELPSSSSPRRVRGSACSAWAACPRRNFSTRTRLPS